MKLHKLIVFILITFVLACCVGQKEDTEPAPEKDPEKEERDDSLFVKRILVTEFTATWCVYCPDMKESISRVAEFSKGKVLEMSVHYLDGMECAAGDSLTSLFGVSSWPTAVFDMNPSSKTSSHSFSVLNTFAEDSFSKASNTCGISITGRSSKGAIDVLIDVSSPVGGAYLLQLALCENGIVASQTGRGDDYVHDRVLRSIPLTKELSLKKSETVHVPFKFDASQFKSSVSLVAYILEPSSGSYIVNNAAELTVQH